MAEHNWPAELPQCFLSQNLRVGWKDPVVRTVPQIGPTRTRRRTTLETYVITGTMRLERNTVTSLNPGGWDQVEVFRNFLVNTLKGGSLRFNWFDLRKPLPSQITPLSYNAEFLVTSSPEQIFTAANNIAGGGVNARFSVEMYARVSLETTSELWMVGSDTDALYVLDRLTGGASRIGTTSFFGAGIGSPTAIAWDGSQLYMVGLGVAAKLFRVSRKTGVAEQVNYYASSGFNVGEISPAGLAWDGSDLYLAGQTTRALYRVSRTTGEATRVGSAANFGLENTIGPDALAWDGSLLYMTASKNLWVLDRSTGEAVVVPGPNSLGVTTLGNWGLAFDGNNLYLVTTGQNWAALHLVNRNTATATRIGSVANFGVGETSPEGLTYAPLLRS